MTQNLKERLEPVNVKNGTDLVRLKVGDPVIINGYHGFASGRNKNGKYSYVQIIRYVNGMEDIQIERYSLNRPKEGINSLRIINGEKKPRAYKQRDEGYEELSREIKNAWKNISRSEE